VLTKNLTPFLFGARGTSRKPPQREMTCVVRAAFAIAPGEPLKELPHPEQGHLSGETFEEGDDEQLGAALVPSDFADFKLSGEVMFLGSCHTPGAKPLPECPVKISVGRWSKALRVVGPRSWGGVAGDTPSEPQPFTAMPLTWQNAFGGPGYGKNPAGKGVDGVEVPRVELPDQPVTTRSGAYDPGTLGPVSPYWPARASLVGKEYGASWKKKRAPYFAEDFDYRFFYSALPDQRIEGFFRGDEEVVLQNLIAGAPIASFSLPGIRVRVFAKGTDGRFREVAMSLDTIVVDGEASKIFLTWRGLDAVEEDDLSDVATMLVAPEPLGSSPSVESYREALEAYEKDPVGLAGKLPTKEMFEGTPTADDVDPVSKLLAEKGVPEDVRVHVRKAVAEAIEADKKRDKPELDLEALIAEAREESPPPMRSIKPGVLPPARLRITMREMLTRIGEARVEIEKKKAEIDKLASGPEVPKEAASVRAEALAQLKQLDEAAEVPRDPRLSQLDPSYSYPEPLSTDEPGPGRNLVDRDLRKRDLRGADLRGANFEAADLSKADLRGAQLQGANLKYAILWKANLDGADLTGADLTLTNCIEAQLAGAKLIGARIAMTCFERAGLDGASLERATGEYVIFTGASLLRASLARAALPKSELDQAKLAGASFVEASIEGALFARSDLTEADFTRAVLAGTSFVEATCDRASFTNAVLARALFNKASLKDARFAGANCTAAFFEHVKGLGASFLRARARQARFYRASLDGADFAQADLMGADFRKAKLFKVSFKGASLYDAKLLEAAGDDVDFSGANLERALISET